MLGFRGEGSCVRAQPTSESCARREIETNGPSSFRHAVWGIIVPSALHGSGALRHRCSELSPVG